MSHTVTYSAHQVTGGCVPFASVERSMHYTETAIMSLFMNGFLVIF